MLFVKFGGELFLAWQSEFTFAELDNDVGSIGHLISSHARGDSPQVDRNAEFVEFKSSRHSRPGFSVCQGSVNFQESWKPSLPNELTIRNATACGPF
jgi:hypothetical protein